MKIGDRIRLRREELGLTQSELAKRMGYKTRNAIFQYEQANNMKLSTVQKFADALGVEPGYLLGWEEAEHENELIEQYLEDEHIKRLVLFAGGTVPEGSREKLVDAIIATMKMLGDFNK